MDCKEFKELVPAFAIDALDEAERAACAAHLGDGGAHEGCAQAAADARALAARLASALPERRVDARVWRAIEGRAQAELDGRRPDSGDDGPAARRRDPPGWGVTILVLGMLAAAAEAPPPWATVMRLACRRAAAANASGHVAR